MASAEPIGDDALAAADVVLEVVHPALSPYLPEAHQAVLAAAIAERSPDVVLVENATAGYDLGAAAAAAADLPFVGYCLERVAGGRRGGVGQRDLRRPAAGDGAHAAAGGVRVNSAALHDEPQASGAARARRSSRRRPSSTACGRRFIEASQPSDEGVDLTTADADRVRRPRDRRRRERRDRGGARLGARRRSSPRRGP